MKIMTRTALAAITAGLLLSPVARAADVTPAAGAKTAQTEKAMPKRTRAPQDMTRQAYVDHAREVAERRFDAMDGNHDGKLTAQERRDYAKKMREARQQRREQRREHMQAPAGTPATPKQ